MVDLKQLLKLTKDLNILYVEDDEAILEALSLYLSKLFHHIDTAINGVEALELYKKNSYDLVITDIEMPKMNGIELSQKIKEIDKDQNIIISTAFSDSKFFLESITLGVEAYVLKPVDYNVLNSAFYKVANKIRKFKEHNEYKNKLEVLLTEKSSENLLQQIEFTDNYEKTLFALIEIIEKRDTYTGKHSLRVATYSMLIAQELNFSENRCKTIYKAAILHDIGKVAIPDSLLLKPTKLKKFEYDLIKEHVNIGFNMLNKIPMFKDISEIINGHHEKLDGSGYPNGLKGDEISSEANIMALCDTFDAMTTSRIYKDKKSIPQALEEIKKLSNTHFKKEIVDAAIKVLKDVKIDKDINQLPHTNLEKERFSYFYKDSLTEVYNEKYLDLTLTKNIYEKKYNEVHLLLIDNFGAYNKKHGWIKGNELLVKIANKIDELCEDKLIFRVHGDDFIVLGLKEEQKKFLENNIQTFLTHYDLDIQVVIKSFDIFEKNICSINKLESYL